MTDPPGWHSSCLLAVGGDARLAHPDLVGLGVELVLDLADDLLEHVLQGDDPDRLVVLVDHQGQVLAVATQGLQQLVEQNAVGTRHSGRARSRRLAWPSRPEARSRSLAWTTPRAVSRPPSASHSGNRVWLRLAPLT